jgi:hypothetical protein
MVILLTDTYAYRPSIPEGRDILSSIYDTCILMNMQFFNSVWTCRNNVESDPPCGREAEVLPISLPYIRFLKNSMDYAEYTEVMPRETASPCTGRGHYGFLLRYHLK